ncbi:MAG: serine hydrolase domain-containing protein [Hyphomonadaceae bacterium]
MELAPLEAGFAPDRLARIETHLMRHYIEPQKIAGCQIGIMRRGRLAYRRSFGQMDRERAAPMAEDSIFRIFSMTKPITSVALMMLYETGAFQLNDPVSRFFPDWKEQRVYLSGDYETMQTAAPKRAPTIRDMLCHTGGLTYGDVLSQFGLPKSDHPVERAYRELRVRRDRGETLSDFMAKLARTPLLYEPGERWLYSLSTDVCGALVEKISGQRFDVFLRERLFAPLKMEDTAFMVTPEKVSRFTANYARGPDKRLRLVDDPQTSAYLQEPVFFGGGGGLVSTLSDYLRFTEMMRRGGELDGARILGPRTVALMTTNHLKGGGALLTDIAIDGFSETAAEGVGFGLGFATATHPAATGLFGEGDFYWAGAASTLFWIDPKEEISVVFMTQLVPSDTFDFRGQLKNIIYSSIVE